MVSKFRIIGWTAEGLRCPDHSVSFRKNDSTIYKISLLQMPNGTGKTTLLDLLRAALSGSAITDSWSQGKIKGFKKRVLT